VCDERGFYILKREVDMKNKTNFISYLFMMLSMSILFYSCKKDSTDPITPTPLETNDWNTTSFPAFKVISLYTSKTGYVYVGTDSNGIYRSTDGGSSWHSVNTGIVQLHINSITEDPSGYLFAGTSGVGIYRSTDQGASWQEVDPFSCGNADTYFIAVNSKGDIFAALNLMGWVLRSTNGGTNWTSLTVASNVFYIYSLAIDTSGKIFAGTSSGIYVSTNNGNSWTKPTTSFSTADILTLCTAANGYVWAGTYDQGMYCSSDRGITWNVTPLSAGRVNVVIYNGTTLFIGTTAQGVYSSKDNGITISTINDKLTNLNVFSLTIHAGKTL
jgi:ligand-binding sensor domain-containing protein